ncbi:hypothetical protein [Planktotalea arctica]|uniref:hypothetical protein n=1 Tax=Planktotalea arctica TaxID=1481893 RepID=UPI000A1756BE|nr:hypothetical protein [Planktotalea arctica]
MTNAVKLCAHIKQDVSKVFAYQYLVTPGKSEQIDGMSVLPFGKFSIHVGAKLHSALLTDCKGRFFGYVLGIAVDRSGLIKGEHQLDELDLDDPQLFARFAEYLDDVAGRYVVLCGAGTEQRVYTDPVAMIGCVYDPTSQRVASSLNLTLNHDIVLNSKSDHEAVEKRGGKYILFNTRDEYCRRMNGSFYLDLETMMETRFWPRTDRFEVPLSKYGKVYDEIINTARHVIGAITDRFKTAMPLSGGRDSRLLAAMAGEHIHKVNQPFTHITNFATRYDATVASLIGKHLDIPHEVHSWRQPSPPERSKFQYRQDLRGFQTAVGAPVRMPDEMERNVHQLLHEDQVVLRGHLTDLLRAVYVFTSKRSRWKEFDWQVQRLFPVALSDFNQDIYKTFLPDFTAWHSSLPPAAQELPLDFMFIEAYYNATVGFTFNGLHKHFYMSPFNSRRLIELSLAINVDYRRTGKPVDDIIYRIDPGLCAIPYYKEAGADLSVLEYDSDWRSISSERMADVQCRFDTNYAEAAAFIEQYEKESAKPVLSLAS